MLLAGGLPKALVLGYSFVKILPLYLSNGVNNSVDLSFRLAGPVSVNFRRVCGRIFEKLRVFDVRIIDSLTPDIVILKSAQMT